MTTTTSIGQSSGWSYSATKSASKSGDAKGADKSAVAPTDTFTPSGQTPPDPKTSGTDLDALLASAGEDAKKAHAAGLDLTDFQKQMKALVLDQMKQAQAALQGAGKSSKLISDILYAVDKDQKAAEVPDEWGADKTSQRIVDFAMAFRGAAKAQGMSDEEFIGTIRKSIQDGFRSAKGDLKDLPGPSAKLFNDTYESSMKKLDDMLASWKTDGQTSASAATSATPPAANPTGGSASSFSVLA